MIYGDPRSMNAMWESITMFPPLGLSYLLSLLLGFLWISYCQIGRMFATFLLKKRMFAT